MLQPKRMKFRRQVTGHNRGLAHHGSRVSFGEYALKATSRGCLTAHRIESTRHALIRHMKRGDKIWIRAFPDRSVTKKPLEICMGKGKGGVEYWATRVQPGKVLYGIKGVSEESVREVFALATAKLPLVASLVKWMMI